jgi:hypothetical protein
VLAESRDEPICEVSAEGFLEPDERRSPFVPLLRAERVHVGEKTNRAGRSHLREDGGGHVWTIGSPFGWVDPWPGVTAGG